MKNYPWQAPQEGGGGGGDSCVTGSSPCLLEVKISGLVPVGVLKSKNTSLRGMAVPFRVTRILKQIKCQSTVSLSVFILELVPLRGENFRTTPTKGPCKV